MSQRMLLVCRHFFGARDEHAMNKSVDYREKFVVSSFFCFLSECVFFAGTKKQLIQVEKIQR